MKQETKTQIVESMAQDMIKHYQLTRDPILKLGLKKVKELVKQRIVKIAQTSDNRRVFLKKPIKKFNPNEVVPIQFKLVVPNPQGRFIWGNKDGKVFKRNGKEVIVTEKEIKL